jgi:sugar phosphate isomerase/epimerase
VRDGRLRGVDKQLLEGGPGRDAVKRAREQHRLSGLARLIDHRPLHPHAPACRIALDRREKGAVAVAVSVGVSVVTALGGGGDADRHGRARVLIGERVDQHGHSPDAAQPRPSAQRARGGGGAWPQAACGPHFVLIVTLVGSAQRNRLVGF